jgi:hypothetical protein
MAGREARAVTEAPRTRPGRVAGEPDQGAAFGAGAVFGVAHQCLAKATTPKIRGDAHALDLRAAVQTSGGLIRRPG